MIANWITGRRSKFVVVVVAILFAGFLASKGGETETSSGLKTTLPPDSQSLAVAELEGQFPSGEVTPAVIVLHSDEGLGDEDISDAVAVVGADAAAGGSSAAGGAGGQADGPPTGPQVSEDGKTAAIAVPIDGVSTEVNDAVDELREKLDGYRADHPGVETAVSGPAGFQTDAAAVFAGINGKLLIGAATLVLILLILIYRSPVFWLIPFFTVLMAEGASRGVASMLADGGVTVTAQAAGIASVLTFGAATDYALLLVARYREELLITEDKHAAMKTAWKSASLAILASSMTVVCGLLTLLLADIPGTSAMGPLGAAGVFLAMVFSLTLLPALLLVFGRKAFWPRVPRFTGEEPEHNGLWARLGRRIDKHPRRTWLGGAAVLVLLALGVFTTNLGQSQADRFAGGVEATTGQKLIADAFPAGSTAPITIVVPAGDDAQAVADAVAGLDDVVGAQVTEQGEPGTKVQAILDIDPFGEEAEDLIPDIREAAESAAPDALVGGPTAQTYDSREGASADNLRVVPAVLIVVGIILIGLLRAINLPLILLLTTIVSFASAFGFGMLVSDLIFGFEGIEPSVPLLAFVFLVALGVDYNIFLVARAREETEEHGTRRGMLDALTVTGGVITSAGIVLAGTFSVLMVIPFVPLIQLGFIIAFGVLLDTLLVRSVVVPSIVLDAGKKVWWPSALARGKD